MINAEDFLWDDMAPLDQQTVLSQWVFEELPEIAELVKSAEERLETATGDGGFDAYTGGAPRVKAQVEALYEEIRARKLRYRVEGAGSRIAAQKIRTPDMVLNKKCEHGCCTDLVLLLASALYHVRIRPLIVVVGDGSYPMHAILGYWVEEHTITSREGLSVPVLNANTFSSHRDKMALVEATDATNPPSKDFAGAETDAEQHLPPHKTVFYAVDVHACRNQGIRSLCENWEGDLRSRGAAGSETRAGRDETRAGRDETGAERTGTREHEPLRGGATPGGWGSGSAVHAVLPPDELESLDRSEVIRTLTNLCPGNFGHLRTLFKDCWPHVSASGAVGPRVDELVGWAESSTGPGLAAIIRVAAREWPRLFQAESVAARLRLPARNGDGRTFE